MSDVDKTEGRNLVAPEDLGSYAFAHSVRVAPDGARAFFEVTRVDVPHNCYHTDLWAAGDAGGAQPAAPRRLTTSGAEGGYDLLDDGGLLFVSRRRYVTPSGEKRADAPEPGCDLFRIAPDGGEAELVASLPGMAVRDWAQLDAARFVVCCRPLLDADAPVVELEDLPFHENGGTYTSGLRWGLYLLDCGALPADKCARVAEGACAADPACAASCPTDAAGCDEDAATPRLPSAAACAAGAGASDPACEADADAAALRSPGAAACEANASAPASPVLLTRPDEDVDSWALAAHRSRLVFASRAYSGLRPATNELWALDVAPQTLVGELASAARAGRAEASAGARASAPSRIRIGDASLRRSNLVAWRDGVVFLASDLRTRGVNEDPQPWFVPADGSAPERPALGDAPDLYYGGGLSCDSLYGGGREVVATDDACFFLTTEFDRTCVRRMDASGAMPQAFELPRAMAYPTCFDTADGRTFWFVAASETGLPEVWRAEAHPVQNAGVAGPGLGECAPDAPALARVTNFSEALAGKHIGVPEPFAFTSGGDELVGYVIKPANYVPGRRYPGVLEIHGGPKVAYGTTFSQEMQCLAARGYFVFFTNPHGSAGRGSAFSDIRGNYGGQDFADLMTLTDEVLARFPDVDPARLAVMGGSYGGFMTNWVIGHTSRFACANSQRSIASFMTKSLVSDIGTWVNMPETSEGPAWDPAAPEGLAFAGDNPRKLWEQSPLAYAEHVRTPTLFLHSDHDYRCPLEEGLQMYAALQLRGVPTRMVVFKGEAHGLCRTGKPQNRIRRLREILAWYDRWLGAGAGLPTPNLANAQILPPTPPYASTVLPADMDDDEGPTRATGA